MGYPHCGQDGALEGLCKKSLLWGLPTGCGGNKRRGNFSCTSISSELFCGQSAGTEQKKGDIFWVTSSQIPPNPTNQPTNQHHPPKPHQPNQPTNTTQPNQPIPPNPTQPHLQPTPATQPKTCCTLKNDTCQVCVAFAGNLDELPDAKAQHNAIAAQTARQVSWVKRKAEGRTKWRPKKRHRLSACHWCVNVDNQIRQSLGLRGFADFIPAKDVHWKKRRHLNTAIDQGSDGLCAGNWLLHMGVILTLWMDFRTAPRMTSLQP